MLPTPEDDLIGAKLGDFVIDSVLSRDQGVSVYQGRGVHMHRKVLITLLDVPSIDPKLLALDHPHILPPLASGDHQGRSYVITPLPEGNRLADRLVGEALPFSQIARWVGQLAGALVYAHQHDVLHSNLTPNAIYIDEYDNLYLTDFGLPALKASVYTAPEVWLGYYGGETADLYALGAMVTHMLTGKPPFSAEDDTALRSQVLYEHPSLPTRMDETPGQTLAKALAKDPLGRYQSAYDFARDFGALPPADQLPLIDADERDFSRITLWSSGAEAAQAQVYSLPTGDAVRGCAWLPSGEAFVAASAAGGVYQCSLKDDKSLLLVQADQPILRFALAAGGERFATLHKNNFVNVWSMDGELLHSLTLQGDSVRRLDLASNGLILASGHDDGSVRLWDLFSESESLSVNAHSKDISALRLSDNGSLFLTGSFDNTLGLWNARTGENLQHFGGHQAEITAAALKGELVLSGDLAGGLFVWDILMQDAPLSLAGHTGTIADCSIQQVGDLILGASAGEDGTLRLWDLRAGREMRLFDGGEVLTCCALNERYVIYGTHSGKLNIHDHTRTEQPAGHESKIMDLRLADETLFSLSADRTLQQTTAQTGSRSFKLSLKGQPRCVEVTPQYIFVGYADGILQCFDREHYRLRWEATAHQAEVNFLARLEGQQLVTGGADGVLACWNVVNGARLNAIAIPTANLRCAMIHAGLVIVGTQEGQVGAWDAITGQRRQQYQTMGQPVMALALAGEVLLAGLADGRVVQWSIEDETPGLIFQAHNCAISAFALNADGRTLLTAGIDCSVCLWDLALRQQLENWQNAESLVKAVWADGRSLISGDERGALGCVAWINV